MSRVLFSLIAFLALAAGATPAAAASWSRPALLLSEPCETGYCSPAPDVAINRHGTVVALYRRDEGLRTLVRIGDAHGRFGAPQLLPTGSYPGQVAIADDGTAVIAWMRNGELRATFRHPGGRFGRSVLVARLAGREAAIDDVAVGLDAAGAGVVAWTDFQSRESTTASVRALDARSEALIGDAKQIDSGEYVSLGDLAINRAGQIALTWIAVDRQQSRIGLVSGGPGGVSDPLQVSAAGENVDDPRAAIDPSGALAVGYTLVTRHGDVGPRGVPILRVRPAGASALGPELRIATAHAGRLFDPQVAFAGAGRATLLYQEKTHVAGFSRAAPLHAVVASADGSALGAAATVADAEIAQPRVASLGDGRLLTLWELGERPQAPLGGALSDAAGAFRSASAPSGRVDPFSDASGNRALAAAGRYAAFIWGGGGTSGYVRISVRRF
jgi:hypothetical protein